MRDLGSLDDDQLIEASLKGEAEAFGELYDRYVNQVFKFIYQRLGDRERAENLTEQVFLSAWESLPENSRRNVKFSAQLIRTARNLLIDNRFSK